MTYAFLLQKKSPQPFEGIWACSAYHEIEHRRPLPVALLDRTCWWWERSLDLMEKAGLTYEIIFTSESVSGVRAAIAAGVSKAFLKG